jgi:small subunit ribosomal protein S20
VANIKSQIKRIGTNEARRVRNKSVRSALKTTAKKVRAADADQAPEVLRQATRDLDRAESRGVLHKRTAARRKSRLARAVSQAAE